MKSTNIFATELEQKKLRKLAKEAQNTPMIALSSSDALNGRDFATSAWNRVQEECHKTALKHGLPEIQGFYGLDQEGQFVTN